VDQIRHILLSTDGSEGSLAAAELAGHLGRDCNARISVLVVHSEAALLLPGVTDANLPGSVPFGVFPRDEARQHIETATVEQIFPDTKNAIGVVPGGIETHQLWGHTTETICDYASNNDVDLIVVGKRGRASFKSLLIGSTAAQIVAHAPCAVAVAP
jgi:nucleotide-binding universal stress UspA family protein